MTCKHTESERKYWNDRYANEGNVFGEAPSYFLYEAQELLPPGGRALDIAGGEGRNALWLANRGFEVELWDLSAVALARAGEKARELGLPLKLREVDLESATIEPGSFDLVICFYYTQRSLFPQMAAALKPGGILIMENMTLEQLPGERPTRNPEFRLKPNELLEAFRGLRVLRYREGAVPAGVPKGKLVAGIVARRD